MGRKKVHDIKCEVVFSPGAQERITQGLVDIWMRVRDGTLRCEKLEERMAQYDAERMKRDA